MKKIYLIMIALILLGTANIFAASYASDLEVSPGAINGLGDLPVAISYRLNDAATNVTVTLYDSGTMTDVRDITGGTARGVNTVYWDGNDDLGANVPVGNYKAKVRVQSADSVSTITTTQWYQDVDPDAASTNPGQCDINKNPQSEHFGHIYLVHANDGTANGTPLIYEYPSDMGVPLATGSAQNGDAITSGGADNDASVNWDENGTVPRHVTVDEDGYVYVGNWYEGGANANSLREIMRFDPDLTNGQIVLGFATNPDFNSPTKSCDVRGTGTDKTIAICTSSVFGTPKVLLYQDTDGDGTWTDEEEATSFTLSAAPDDPNATDMNIQLDADGNIYVCSDEGTNTDDHDVAKYQPDGTRLWAIGAGDVPNLDFIRSIRLWDGANPEDTSDDVLILDSSLGSSAGITVVDPADGSVIDSAQTWTGWMGLDVVGNVYGIAQLDRYVKMSLIKGAITDYTTHSLGSVTFNTQVPAELSIFSVE